MSVPTTLAPRRGLSSVVASCTKDGGGAKVLVDATVSSIAFDPDVLDNTAQGKTNLK